MFWLSVCSISPELDPIASDARPWAILKAFWQFSNSYGEYHSRPPSLRRRFIIEKEKEQHKSNSCVESCS